MTTETSNEMAMMDLLFGGVGWTDLAAALNRIAVGTLFVLSGDHKLFNAERLPTGSFVESGTTWSWRMGFTGKRNDTAA
jgi:hypothetical protein